MKTKFIAIVCILVMPFLFTGCIEWCLHKRIGHTCFHLVESYIRDPEGKTLPYLAYETDFVEGYIGVSLDGSFPLDVRSNSEYLLVRCYDGKDRNTVTQYYIIKPSPLDSGPPYEQQRYDTGEDFQAAITALGLDVQKMEYTDNHLHWHLPFF